MMVLEDRLKAAVSRRGTRIIERESGCAYALPAGRTACCVNVICNNPASEHYRDLGTTKRCGVCKTRSAVVNLSGVICAHNEGEEVWKTVGSMARSTDPAKVKVETIVVDDGSEDGCCDFALELAKRPQSLLKHIRNSQPLGIDTVRNQGYSASSGDVVSFHDGHMAYTKGSMQVLAHEALAHDAIICPTSTGFENPCNFVGWGARLEYEPGKLPCVKWILDQTEPIEQRPAPLGGCYVMSRHVAEMLAAPTGYLWEGTIGRYGYSEESLAMKAWLLDIPILSIKGAVVAHNYASGKVLGPTEHSGNGENCALDLMTMLGHDLFTKHFGGFFKGMFAPCVATRLVKEAEKRRPAQGVWKHDPAEMFTKLFTLPPRNT